MLSLVMIKQQEKGLLLLLGQLVVATILHSKMYQWYRNRRKQHAFTVTTLGPIDTCTISGAEGKAIGLFADG